MHRGAERARSAQGAPSKRTSLYERLARLEDAASGLLDARDRPARDGGCADGAVDMSVSGSFIRGQSWPRTDPGRRWGVVLRAGARLAVTARAPSAWHAGLTTVPISIRAGKSSQSRSDQPLPGTMMKRGSSCGVLERAPVLWCWDSAASVWWAWQREAYADDQDAATTRPRSPHGNWSTCGRP